MSTRTGGERDVGPSPRADQSPIQVWEEFPILRPLGPHGELFDDDQAKSSVRVPTNTVDSLLEQLTVAGRCISTTRGCLLTVPTPGAEIVAIIHGAVFLSRVSVSGSEVTLAVLIRGDLLSRQLLEIIVNDCSSMTAVSNETTVCQVSCEALCRLTTANPQTLVRIHECMGRSAGRILSHCLDLATGLALECVSVRLARVLLKVARLLNAPEIHLTHQELGRMIGARQTTVTRELHALAAGGLIRMHGRSRGIVNLDFGELEKYAYPDS